MTRTGAPAAAALLVALAACSDAPPPPAEPTRDGRFGSLRDLVLFERPRSGPEGALFVDRFEVTIGDWREFAATAEGRAVGADEVPANGAPVLPIAFVDLHQARAFARWRLLRLPRLDEWRYACVGDGRSRFPWGDQDTWTRANTGDLGLGQPMAVGTFESGRRVGGDQPYDLVGNVSEWTETIAPDWWADLRVPWAPSAEARVAGELVRGGLPFAPWLLPGGLPPVVAIAAAAGRGVPRAVVGADFQTSMQTLVEFVPAGDRRSRTGLRLCATAAELIANLGAEPGPIRAVDREQVRRFVQRGGHRPVLAAAFATWARGRAAFEPAQPLALLLRDELLGSGAGR